MAVALRQSRRFDASSPVTRYWLANCVGFSLSGGGHGTVERVLADISPHDPSLLEVRTSRRRMQRVPTSAVIAVVPQEKLLVVDHRLRLMPDRKRDLSLRLRWSARVLRRIIVVTAALLTSFALVTLGLLASFAVELMQLSRRAWREGSPVSARTSRRGGSEAARLVRSVPWQSYGRSARSATTRLSTSRSSRSSRRRTTSSGRSNGKRSSDRARTTSST